MARAAFANAHGKDKPFLSPLAKLLTAMNDPTVDLPFQIAAAEKTLPYFHRPVEGEEQPSPMFDFGALNSGKAILAAQKKVMKALGNGSINSTTAGRYVAMLDALRKSHECVVTEDRLLDYEETRKQVEAGLDRQPP
jgi:hypothetical protein